MRFAVMALLIGLSTNAYAALAPQYQRQVELQRIIADARVQEALQGSTIDSISIEQTDLYKVVGGFCIVMVRIRDLPPPGEGWAGPRQFDLEVSPARCR